MIPTTETVTVQQVGSLDDWGRPVEGSVETFKCRIDYRTQVVKADNGEDAIAKATILIKGVANVTTNDTVSWTDQFGTHKAKPISVSPVKDLSSKVLFTKVVV